MSEKSGMITEYGLDPADCVHKYGEEHPVVGWVPYNYCPWCGNSITVIQRAQLVEDDIDCEKGGCAD